MLSHVSYYRMVCVPDPKRVEIVTDQPKLLLKIATNYL